MDIKTIKLDKKDTYYFVVDKGSSVKTASNAYKSRPNIYKHAEVYYPKEAFEITISAEYFLKNFIRSNAFRDFFEENKFFEYLQNTYNINPNKIACIKLCDMIEHTGSVTSLDIFLTCYNYNHTRALIEVFSRFRRIFGKDFVLKVYLKENQIITPNKAEKKYKEEENKKLSKKQIFETIYKPYITEILNKDRAFNLVYNSIYVNRTYLINMIQETIADKLNELLKDLGITVSKDTIKFSKQINYLETVISLTSLNIEGEQHV